MVKNPLLFEDYYSIFFRIFQHGRIRFPEKARAGFLKNEKTPAHTH